MNYLKLNDVCLNITDGTHSTVVDDSNGECYLLSCKNVKNGSISITGSDRKINLSTLYSLRKRTKMSINDIVLTTVGTIGESSVINVEQPNFEFQRSVAIIKPNLNLIKPKFLHYYLISAKGQVQIKSRIKGAAQPCLFLNDLQEIEIPKIDVSKQQHIVDNRRLSYVS